MVCAACITPMASSVLVSDFLVSVFMEAVLMGVKNPVVAARCLAHRYDVGALHFDGDAATQQVHRQHEQAGVRIGTHEDALGIGQ